MRKAVATLLLGWLTLLAAVSAHGFEFFAANRYDELAALPASSLGAPTGLVSGWGSAFVALGGLANTSSSDKTNGSLAAGMGLGDPIKSIGSVASLSIGSVSRPTSASGFQMLDSTYTVPSTTATFMVAGPPVTSVNTIVIGGPGGIGINTATGSSAAATIVILEQTIASPYSFR